MTDYNEHMLKMFIMILDNWYLHLWIAAAF